MPQVSNPPPIPYFYHICYIIRNKKQAVKAQQPTIQKN